MTLTAAQARILEPAIALHVIAALLAVLIGAWVLAARKGTPAHRLAGRGWAIAMAVTATSSFFIPAQVLPVATPLGPFGPIHLLSAFTLWSLARAVMAIRTGNVTAHRRGMQQGFAGLAIAGMFTLVPGRTLNAWLMALAA
jgi:uncharacterized membrane protein